MDGGINRIERAGPQPAARVRRVGREERVPFTLDDAEPREEARHDEDQDTDGGHDDAHDLERPIAPRGEDESGGHIDLTA